MAEVILKIELEWREVPTTCEPCSMCEEIIYGKQYRLFLNTKCEKGEPETEIILCQSCYECVKED